MRTGTLWRDRDGYVRTSWVAVAYVLGVVLFIVAIIGAVLKPIEEANCNARVERLSSPLVVDGDFDLWANECYVTLTDGRVIPMSQHRTIEHEEVIR